MSIRFRWCKTNSTITESDDGISTSPGNPKLFNDLKSSEKDDETNNGMHIKKRKFIYIKFPFINLKHNFEKSIYKLVM